MPKIKSSEARLGQATATCNEKSPEVSPRKTGLSRVLQAALASVVNRGGEGIQYHTADLLLNFHKTIRPTTELKVELLER